MFSSRVTTPLVVAAALLAAAAWRPAAAAEPDGNAELIKMIAELVGDQDRDMRALGFQQIREEVPGEPATLRFAALLPTLPPEAQVGLIEALSDRGDRAARPAILERLKHDDGSVRAAALQALGALGSAEDVPLLAAKSGSDAPQEAAAARGSLARLRGPEINKAILAAMATGDGKTHAGLLAALAARSAKETVPAILDKARDPQAEVRLAALDALRPLADATHAAALASLVKAAKSADERRRAELAVSSLCGRNREKCVEPIAAAWQDADTASRVVFLRALARCGGAKAIELIAAQLNSADEAVRTEAARMVCAWPDAAALPHLSRLAESAQDLRGRVLAIRGLVRMASPQPHRPADLETLKKALSGANRAQEKRLVLGALGTVPSVDALRVVAPLVDDKEVNPEACLAAVMIAEKLGKTGDAVVAETLDKVARRSQEAAIVARAKKMSTGK